MTLSSATVRQYVDFALMDNPAVTRRLIEGYSQIGEQRREINAVRARDLQRATIACAATVVLVGAELALAFVAVVTA